MNIETILSAKGSEVRTVRPETVIAEAVRRMRSERVGALVASEDGATIVGIISDRGIMNAIADEGIAVMERQVGDVMTKEVFTCQRDDRVASIMALMTARRIRHIPVVDGEKRLVGIVSIGDVVKHHLDEIQQEAVSLREYISAPW
ncbi:MAG: CBS domain-containing protein [Geminicoccaceae bacterium]